MFLLLVGILFLPFLIYLSVVVAQVSDEMDVQTLKRADQLLTQTAAYLTSKLETVLRTADSARLDASLLELVSKPAGLYTDDIPAWIRDATKINRVLSGYRQSNPAIRDFVLYTKQGLGATQAAQENFNFRPYTAVASSPWGTHYDKILADGLGWQGPRAGYRDGEPTDLRLLRIMVDQAQLGDSLGFLQVDIRISTVTDILENGKFSAHSLVLLVDRDLGGIVASAQGSPSGSLAGWPRLVATEGKSWTPVRHGGQEYQVGSRVLEGLPWSLVMAIPTQDIGAIGEKLRNLMVGIFALLVLIMVPISFVAASSSTRRLGLLITGARKVGHGDLSVSLPVEGRDEIGELSETFNGMVDRIRSLVDERYQLGIEVKSHEMSALQSQINPHFLYNTLDMIACEAIEVNQPQIVRMVTELSRFYRLSLSGGADVVTLRQEIDHARTYVAIQNLRYELAVDFSVDVADTCLDVSLPKLTLQPLVENAILHGILEKKGSRGAVSLRAKPDESFDGEGVLVEVEDDGIGLVLARVEALLAEPFSSASSSGYGIRNIHRRLVLRHGADSGLTFRSEAGHGTTVSFRVPRG